jgi:hypothetical protein
MPTPSWDLAITVIFLVGIAFGYILQRDKIVATLLGVYAGLIMTQAVSGTVQNFFQGDTTLFNQVWIKANTNPFTVRALVFFATILLVSTKANISGGKAKGILSPMEIVIYSILTTGLVLSSVFHFMPQDSITAFTMTSRMAKLVINNYTWWIILPMIFMFVSGWLHRDSSSD